MADERLMKILGLLGPPGHAAKMGIETVGRAKDFGGHMSRFLGATKDAPGPLFSWLDPVGMGTNMARASSQKGQQSFDQRGGVMMPGGSGQDTRSAFGPGSQTPQFDPSQLQGLSSEELIQLIMMMQGGYR